MRKSLVIPVFEWLRCSGILVSRRLLKTRLQSHPDFPSLASITDTLDELGIHNLSMIVDKEKLSEVPLPFLTYHSGQGGHFTVVRSIKSELIKNKDFVNNWKGVVVLVERTAGWQDKENAEKLAEEKKTRFYKSLVGLFIFLCAMLSIYQRLDITTVSLLLLSFVGLFVSILIVLKESGISNEMGEKLCSINTHIDCDAVMQSKGSRFISWFNWGDAGLIYFTSYFICQLTASRNILPLLSLGSLPFIFFSIYYQWRVVGKWCILCLVIVNVLLIQFFLQINIFFYIAHLQSLSITRELVSSLFFVVFIATITGATWILVIRPLLKNNNEYLENNFSLLRFKNSQQTFSTLLSTTRKVNNIPLIDDLQIGSADMPVQIIVACNPYCMPCSKSHKILHDLAEQRISGVTIMFSIKKDNKDNIKAEAISYLLQVMSNRDAIFKREVLLSWYSDMNLEKFKLRYPLKKRINVKPQLTRHMEWTEQTKITFTPTLFINGHEFPKGYRTSDLASLLRNQSFWENNS